jgi:hypothetical protein
MIRCEGKCDPLRGSARRPTSVISPVCQFEETDIVHEWEYRKVDLNERPRMTDDITLLADAGKDGWELAQITPNNIAYLKRLIEDPVSTEDTAVNGHDAVGSPHEVKAKYRDPATGETWSGRGRMANWLKRKHDAGEEIDDYLV